MNPHVVFYNHCARMSGAEIALLNTVDQLGDWTVSVILGEYGPLVPALQSRGVSTEVLPLPDATRDFSRNRVGFSMTGVTTAVRTLTYASRLRRRLRSLDPDVIVSNSMKGHMIVAASTILTRIPFVCYVRDRITTDFMSAAGVQLERWVIRRRAAGVLANSQSTMETAPASEKHRVRSVVPSPVQPCSPRAGSPGNSDRQHLVFGIVGRLTPWKGQELAVRAFAKAFPQENHRLHIVGGPIFGETDYQSGLQRLIEDLGLEARIRLQGHVDDVYAEIRDWDSLVHSSIIPEPFGQVIVQGMSAGLAVIASGEGGPLETIEHMVDGILFRPRDVDSLASTMRLVAENSELRKALGEKARAKADKYVPASIGTRVGSSLRVFMR